MWINLFNWSKCYSSTWFSFPFILTTLSEEELIDFVVFYLCLFEFIQYPNFIVGLDFLWVSQTHEYFGRINEFGFRCWSCVFGSLLSCLVPWCHCSFFVEFLFEWEVANNWIHCHIWINLGITWTLTFLKHISRLNSLSYILMSDYIFGFIEWAMSLVHNKCYLYQFDNFNKYPTVWLSNTISYSLVEIYKSFDLLKISLVLLTTNDPLFMINKLFFPMTVFSF